MRHNVHAPFFETQCTSIVNIMCNYRMDMQCSATECIQIKFYKLVWVFHLIRVWQLLVL